MFETLMPAVSNFAGNLGKGVGEAIGGGGGPLVSGTGSTDARGFMDGSGWTVSTGSSRATGGTSGGTRQEGGMPSGGGPLGSGVAPLNAGINPVLALAMCGAFAWYIAKR